MQRRFQRDDKSIFFTALSPASSREYMMYRNVCASRHITMMQVICQNAPFSCHKHPSSFPVLPAGVSLFPFPYTRSLRHRSGLTFPMYHIRCSLLSDNTSGTVCRPSITSFVKPYVLYSGRELHSPSPYFSLMTESIWPAFTAVSVSHVLLLLLIQYSRLILCFAARSFNTFICAGDGACSSSGI